MLTLSILQPWASLVVMGYKPLETRGWHTEHRGPLLIHSSARKHGLSYASQHPVLSLFLKSKNIDLNALPLGHILGQVNLTTITPLPQQGNLSNYGWLIDAQLVWHFEQPVQFMLPLPAKGKLGLWEFTLPT